jgi:hypothetical protein
VPSRVPVFQTRVKGSRDAASCRPRWNGPASIGLAGNELRVILLALLSSAHRAKAIAAICAELSRRAALFQAQRLRLNYAVKEVH